MGKFLVFSDLHLHQWQYGANYANGWNSRLLAQANVLDQIHQCCLDRDIKNVFFCGDLFHTHSKMDAACVSIATNFFVKLGDSGIHSTVMIGNHDMADKAGMVSSLHWLRGFRDVSLTLDYTTWPNDVKNTSICYMEDKEKLKLILSQVPIGYYVFMHQGVSGTSVGSDFVIPNEILDPSMVPDTVKHAFTGHYHSHRKVNDKLTIIGSPLQHTWADSGEDRGWLIVDNLTGEYERVLSDAPKFVKMVAPVRTGVSNNYVKITGPFPPAAQENARKDLIENGGALSVEFFNPTKSEVPQVRTSEENFNLNAILKKFQEAKSLDDRQIKIGEQLRGGTYDARPV